jgi:hypothetical protein
VSASSAKDKGLAKSLVLVVGAGASHEAGLPLGSELRGQVAKALDIRYDDFGSRVQHGDLVVNEALRQTARERGLSTHNDYLRVAWRICAALPLAISVDNVLDALRSDEIAVMCGKLAIARCILEAERASTLVTEQGTQLNFERLSSTWYTGFFQRLTEGCQASDLPERFESVTVVCFNYDRCVEQYLSHALARYYSMDAVQAAAALKHLEVLHPYGSMGPVASSDAQVAATPFGMRADWQRLMKASAELRTFTEGADPKSGVVEQVRDRAMSCSRIAFLGFAFHPQNVDLLFGNPSGALNLRDCSVYATGLGISRSDGDIVKQKLGAQAGIAYERINIAHDARCADLFSLFRLSLGLA